jgi:hypothetical protein
MDECCIAAAVLAPQNTEIKENLSPLQFNRLNLSTTLRAKAIAPLNRGGQLPNSCFGCTIIPDHST